MLYKENGVQGVLDWVVQQQHTLQGKSAQGIAHERVGLTATHPAGEQCAKSCT